jgi:hypothetical protein
MAKKTKKQSRYVPGSGAAARTGQNGGENPSSTSFSVRNSGPEFNPDYSTTIKDLKRIGLLAGTFFAVLIVISFFLR